MVTVMSKHKQDHHAVWIKYQRSDKMASITYDHGQLYTILYHFYVGINWIKFMTYTIAKSQQIKF